jgi:hypothetical protein
MKATFRKMSIYSHNKKHHGGGRTRPPLLVEINADILTESAKTIFQVMGDDQLMINFLPKRTKPQLSWGMKTYGAEGGILTQIQKPGVDQ